MISTAISTINSSIDGAISRIDTLNNFPKVMSNLGIDANESAEAINSLSDGLKGLPTTLNDGALAVQRFTSKNGDVKKSVSLFLGVNNAILAGGASTQIQASALEQLSQAYAKGKPDMQEWRSLQQAMPAQLKQIAKEMLGNKDALKEYMKKAQEYADNNPLSSTGKELVEQLDAVKNGSGDMTTALGTALRTGIISMDEFVDKIMDMNKNGSGEFKSFEEQAKNATGGIETSITNAKTAVTRGVANIIDAIDKSLKKTSIGGLSGLISKIGTSAEKVFKKVANVISEIDLNAIIKRLKNVGTILGNNIKKILETITNVLAKLLKYIINHKEAAIVLVNAIIGLVTAYKSLQVAMKTIQTINMVKSIVSTLNPVGLLVAGITALTTTLALSAIAISKERESMNGLKEEAQAQQITWQELKKTRQQSLENSSTEIATTQKLADELRQITDENGNVKEGYENRAKYILGELNTALGTEYKMNGNIIQNYKELKENIDQLILAKKADAALNAYKAEYEQAIKNETDATKTLAGLRKQLNEEIAKTPKMHGEELEKQKRIEHISNEIKKQTELIGEYGYTIQNYEKLTSASVSNNAEEINTAIQEMGISYDEAKQKVNTSLTEQIKSQENYVGLLKQLLEDSKKANDKYQEDILKKQLETEEKSLTSLRNTLADETSAVIGLSDAQKEAWADLANNDYQAYNQYLSKIPPETKKTIEEATGIVATDTSLKDAVGELSNEANNSYYFDISKATAVKLSENANVLETDTQTTNASQTLAERIKENFNNRVNGYEWGADLTSNLASGMTSKIPFLKASAERIASVIKENIGHSVPKAGPLKDELTYMPDMIDNLVNGIDKNKYKLTRAVQGLTGEMESKLKNAVNLEVGNMNATASVRSNNLYNSVIKLNAEFNGNVVMDKQKTGRILAPEITKTIKVGGLS